MRVAIFVGNDITSHLIVNQVFPRILAAGHTPYLYFTGQKPNPKAEPELRELFLYERLLLNSYVYPYLDSLQAPLHDAALSPAGIAKLYQGSVVVRFVRDVNDSEFIASLATEKVRLGFSVRCYQKFRSPLIDYFRPEPDSPTQFANLHPGILPQYRGVLTFARSMLHGEQEAGFTLHRIDEEWDSGEIMSVTRAPLDYKRSVLENMWDQRDQAAGQLLNAVDEAEAHGRWTSSPQATELAGYYSHLDRASLDQLECAGIDLMSPQAVLDLLAGAFTRPGSPERFELRGILTGVTSRRPEATATLR